MCDEDWHLILADDGGEVLEGSAGGHLKVPLPENILYDLLLVVEPSLQVLHVELKFFLLFLALHPDPDQMDPLLFWPPGIGSRFRIWIRIPFYFYGLPG
jgi:hypothetical protein